MRNTWWHLVAHPFVLVGQGELGAGVGAFTAHDEAGAVRVAGKVDQAGQCGEVGPLAEGSVLVERGCQMRSGSERIARRTSAATAMSTEKPMSIPRIRRSRR